MIIRRSVIKYIFFVSVFLVVLIAVKACAGNTISGKVVSVADGDTITVLDSSKSQHKIRVYGVDCPESHQDYGQKAKQFTSDLVFGKTIEVKVMDTDRYGRTVGIVNVDGKCLNEELVKNGMAWFYGQYCKASFCSQWNQYHEEARSGKIGLWSMQNHIPPWEFRSKSAKTNPTQITTIVEYHGNSKSMVFHSSKCRFYNCKNCTMIFHDRSQAIKSEFKSCGECKP
jgi:endonuclease YncB( thermonuclease family)